MLEVILEVMQIAAQEAILTLEVIQTLEAILILEVTQIAAQEVIRILEVIQDVTKTKEIFI